MCFQDAAKCHQLLLDPHGYKHFRIRLSDKTCNTSYYFSLSDWMVPSRIVGLSESFGKDLQALYLLMRSFEWVVLWISSSYTESPTHRQLLWLCIAPFRWLLLWCIGFDLPQCANRLPLVRVANSPVPIDSDMNPKLGWEQRVRSKLVRYFGIAIGPLWNWQGCASCQTDHGDELRETRWCLLGLWSSQEILNSLILLVFQEPQ